jgi:hypothetical protein
MLLVNDSDAALIGSLRPRPENRLGAALREEASFEEAVRQRSRVPFWVAGGLIAGVVALVVAEHAPSAVRAGATVLARPAAVASLAAAPAASTRSAAPVVAAPAPAQAVTPTAPAARAALEAPARVSVRKAGSTARKATGKRASRTRLAANRVAIH